MADEYSTKRIINLPAESGPAEGDVFVVDNESTGTKKLPVTSLMDNTLTKERKAAPAKETGIRISKIKEDASAINIYLTPTIFEGVNARATGLIQSETNDTYRYEIPINVNKIHIKTAFYGTSRIVLTDKESDVNFAQYPSFVYPENGYVALTNVDVELQTYGFKYAYVTLYRQSNTSADASYSELERIYKYIDEKVNIDGIAEVEEKNTTFFEEKKSENLLDIKNTTETAQEITLIAESQHVITTVSDSLTANKTVIFGEITLPAGSYTLAVYPDDNYAAYGGATFLGLYTGANKNVLNTYAFITYTEGVFKAFTIDEDTALYLGFRVQNYEVANTIYENLQSIGFYAGIYSGDKHIPWISPKSTYRLIWTAEESANDANFSMFEKFAVIGDSYASGQIYLSGSPVNYYNLSWGQVLARMTGSKCINMSRGGLTTKTWLEDTSYGLDLLQSSDPQGLYIVVLGINDYTSINSGTYALGTLADFDLDNYQNTPDTFYGNLCKIIGYCKAKSPNGKIILSTMALNDTQGRKDINTAIVTCADLAGCACIKQYESDYFKSKYYVNGMISGHPTAPNYSGMAKAIKKLIDGCINDNYEYFYDFVW